MSESKKVKGTWMQRLSIIFLGLVLGVLLFWLLEFVTKDIDTLSGPELSEVESRHVDAELVIKQESLKESLDGIKKNIQNQREQQGILQDSSNNLQKTINQLLSIQSRRLEKNSDVLEEDSQTLLESQKLFLDNQKQYQDLNKAIGELTLEQQKLKKEASVVSAEIKEQRSAAREEHKGLMSKHRFKIASLKLAVLLPVFLIAAWLFIKKRSGNYGPLVYAAFIAVFAKTSLVVHEYFPHKYFKYIALDRKSVV